MGGGFQFRGCRKDVLPRLGRRRTRGGGVSEECRWLSAYPSRGSMPGDAPGASVRMWWGVSVVESEQ